MVVTYGANDCARYHRHRSTQNDPKLYCEVYFILLPNSSILKACFPVHVYKSGQFLKSRDIFIFHLWSSDVSTSHGVVYIPNIAKVILDKDMIFFISAFTGTTFQVEDKVSKAADKVTSVWSDWYEGSLCMKGQFFSLVSSDGGMKCLGPLIRHRPWICPGLDDKLKVLLPKVCFRIVIIFYLVWTPLYVMIITNWIKAMEKIEKVTCIKFQELSKTFHKELVLYKLYSIMLWMKDIWKRINLFWSVKKSL